MDNQLASIIDVIKLSLEKSPRLPLPKDWKESQEDASGNNEEVEMGEFLERCRSHDLMTFSREFFERLIFAYENSE